MARWHHAPCMYCCEPVGPDGDTDDGEFYVCARCRQAAARSLREVDDADPEPSLPFELRLTRADLDSYLTHAFGGSATAPEALAERILERIRGEATGDLDFDREPTVPLDLAPLPPDDKARILSHVARHSPRFTSFGAVRA
jgi:hypothetical protein